MTQQRDSGFGTYTAAEAIGEFIRVKLSSTTDRTVAIAGEGEIGIGMTQEAVASGGEVLVKEWNAGGTFKMTANEAIATRNCDVYAGAAGKVQDTAAGEKIGQALDTASATGAVIEVIPRSAPTDAAGDHVASIDDNTGGTTGGTAQTVDTLTTVTTVSIDDKSGGTSGGTERIPVCGSMTALTITDSSGGTAAASTIPACGAMTAVAIAEGTLGGTTGGTESLVIIRGSGYSAGPIADISKNFQVIYTEHNELVTDLATVLTAQKNGIHVLADNCKALKIDLATVLTAQKNGAHVIADALAQLRADLVTVVTNSNNNFKVLSTQLNALIASLEGSSQLDAS